jgi:hypothetical protein
MAKKCEDVLNSLFAEIEEDSRRYRGAHKIYYDMIFMDGRRYAGLKEKYLKLAKEVVH